MRRDDRSGESCACFDVAYANVELSQLRLGRSGALPHQLTETMP